MIKDKAPVAAKARSLAAATHAFEVARRQAEKMAGLARVKIGPIGRRRGHGAALAGPHHAARRE